jgi:MFS family permease
LNATLYFALIYFSYFYSILGAAAVAGIGGSLLGPAISAFFLDITAEQYRSRVIGIKESSFALGGVAGPLLVVVAIRFTDAHGVFFIAGAFTILAMLLALTLLRDPRNLRQTEPAFDSEIASQRGRAAKASLRGVVMRATAVRQSRSS